MLEVSKRLIVLVPVFNEEKYIEKTLLSLKSQDFDDVSFIVSDNKSTDDTWNICKKITKDDPRFILIQQTKNIGAGKNIDFLYDYADSEYFMLLGGHDYIVGDSYLSSGLHLLGSNPYVVMALGTPFRITDDVPQGVFSEDIRHYSGSKLARFLQASKTHVWCTQIYSIVRRSVLAGYKIHADQRGADFTMIAYLLWHGKLAYISGGEYHVRTFSHRTSTQNERILGTDEYLSSYDFIVNHLNVFDKLYTGDERMRTYLHNEMIASFDKRFSVRCLMENDEK